MDRRILPAYNDLRNKVFTIIPEKFGVPTTDNNGVFGVIMDMGFVEGWATLVVLADGNASIYLSTGGGVVGGVVNDVIREAAVAMIEIADQFAGQMAATENTPLPVPGEVTFYVLTNKGIRAATAPENDLIKQQHMLSPFFNAGQDVITQLRLMSELQ